MKAPLSERAGRYRREPHELQRFGSDGDVSPCSTSKSQQHGRRQYYRQCQNRKNSQKRLP
jgi:hypothetical protein